MGDSSLAFPPTLRVAPVRNGILRIFHELQPSSVSATRRGPVHLIACGERLRRLWLRPPNQLKKTTRERCAAAACAMTVALMDRCSLPFIVWPIRFAPHGVRPHDEGKETTPKLAIQVVGFVRDSPLTVKRYPAPDHSSLQPTGVFPI